MRRSTDQTFQAASRVQRRAALAVTVVLAVGTLTVWTFSHGSTVRVSGYLEPSDAVSLRARVAGRVTEVRVNAGDHVAAGDTIVTLDSTGFDQKLRSSLARADILQSQIEANRRLIHDLRNLHSAVVEQASSELSHQRERVKVDATERLVDRGYSPSDSLLSGLPDDVSQLGGHVVTELSMRIAEASLRTAKADTITLARTVVENRRLEAEMKAALEEASFYRSKTADCAVVSPISGCVLAAELRTLEDRFVNEGDLICTVGSTQNWSLRAVVSEGDRGRLAINQGASVTIGGSPTNGGIRLRGSVASIAVAPETKTPESTPSRPMYPLTVRLSSPEPSDVALTYRMRGTAYIDVHNEKSNLLRDLLSLAGH